MKRITIFGALLLSAALVSAALLVSKARSTALPDRPDRPVIQDAPIGWIECERVPMNKPDGREREEDHRSPPYTAVVDVIDWPEMTPRPLAADQIEVPGAGGVELLGPGRVLVTGIELGMSMVSVVAAATDKPDQLVALGAGRRGLLAQRNPVAFARHAITHCQLVVFESDDLQNTLHFHGRVFDRETGEPLSGASVFTGFGNATTTDEEGVFSFPEPLTLQEAFSSGIEMPGYTPFALTLRSLNIPWLEHWKETGEMVVTLGKTSANQNAYRPFSKKTPEESSDR